MQEYLTSWVEINTANYLREWQICSLAVQAAVLFIGFAIFFKKGIGFPENPNLRSFYYRLANLFTILGFSIFVYIAGVYYCPTVQVSYMVKTISIGIGLFGNTLLFRNLEKLKIINTKNTIPNISTAFTITIFALSIFPANVFAPIIALIDWFIIPCSLFLYISFQEKEAIRMQSFFLTLGFMLFFGNLMVIPDIIETLIPNIRFVPGSFTYVYYNFVSFVLVYFGVMILLFFGKINYFFEFKWSEKINSILMMMKSGEIIFHRDLKKGVASISMDEGKQLLSNFSEQLEKTGNPKKIVEREGYVLIFEQGIHVLALLVADEYFGFFEVKLKEFLRDFELFYEDFLISWEDDFNVFESSYKLVDRHFQVGGAK